MKGWRHGKKELNYPGFILNPNRGNINLYGWSDPFCKCRGVCGLWAIIKVDLTLRLFNCKS